MVFRLARTFTDPTSPANAQRGFPAPGSGAQTTGPAQPLPYQTPTRAPVRPTAGVPTWGAPTYPEDAQRGYPSPEAPNQRRPAGSMPNVPPIFGNVAYTRGPVWDHGAADWVPVTGKVLTNPIGAGIVAPYRSQPSYGPAAQYASGAIWWTSQAIPTSVNLQGLTNPAALLAILGKFNVQAAYRTTG